MFAIIILGNSTALIAQQKPKKVSQVTIRDSYNEPMKIPKLGEKHLLIFYPDPDHGTQNSHFTDYLEEHQINSTNIYSFGVINLKDAPLYPNSLVRSIVRKKCKKTGADIFFDVDHSLRDGWGLGDVNDKFTIIFVTKDREIVFLKRGYMTESDIKKFNAVIDKYR